MNQKEMDELDRKTKALQRIVKWFGEFPDTRELHTDGSKKSYGFCFGSNGERDFMRNIANDALNKNERQEKL